MPPDPTTDARVRVALMIGVPATYLALLLMLSVYWLSFGHDDLKPVCLAGYAIFALATQQLVGHLLGVSTTTQALLTARRMTAHQGEAAGAPPS